MIAETWNYDWFQQDGRWQWRRTERDSAIATGGGAITPAASLRATKRLAWGDYRLEVTSAAGAKTVAKFAAGWGSPAKEGDAPDLVRVGAKGTLVLAVENGKSGAIGDPTPHLYGEWQVRFKMSAGAGAHICPSAPVPW